MRVEGRGGALFLYGAIAPVHRENVHLLTAVATVLWVDDEVSCWCLVVP